MKKKEKIASFIDMALNQNILNYLIDLSSQKTASEKNINIFKEKFSIIEKRLSSLELQQFVALDIVQKKLEDLNLKISRSSNQGFFSKSLELKDNIITQNSQSVPKKSNTFIEPVTGMEFVWVPAGTFNMGNVFGLGHSNEIPTHKVELEGFWIAKYPVTQAQWIKIMKSNPSNFIDKLNNPVECVTWDMAIDFGKKLNKISQKSADSSKFRLPTEEEWEYAARSAGRFQIFAGGDNLDSLGWYKGNCKSTMPVGQKTPNGLDIFDMSGNVFEWTSDVYDQNAYSNKFLNFIKNDRKKIFTKTVRGGSWMNVKNYCRTTFRTGKIAHLKFNTVGFRVAYG